MPILRVVSALKRVEQQRVSILYKYLSCDVVLANDVGLRDGSANQTFFLYEQNNNNLFLLHLFLSFRLCTYLKEFFVCCYWY